MSPDTEEVVHKLLHPRVLLFLADFARVSSRCFDKLELFWVGRECSWGDTQGNVHPGQKCSSFSQINRISVNCVLVCVYRYTYQFSDSVHDSVIMELIGPSIHQHYKHKWSKCGLFLFRGCITLKRWNFLNTLDCSGCSIIWLHPLSHHYFHITDDDLSNKILNYISWRKHCTM